MAESRDTEELQWFSPDPRAILPLDAFHIPRTLKKAIARKPFDIRINTAFEEIIRACAGDRFVRPHPTLPLKGMGNERERGEGGDRTATWINDEIIALYTQLHKQGHAHSVECWQNSRLAGGLYGVSLGGAFFGESMFSCMPNASKIALVHLVERLRACGYTLLDTQYENPHLRQFGVMLIPREDYLSRLSQALQISPSPSSRFCTASPISG